MKILMKMLVAAGFALGGTLQAALPSTNIVQHFAFTLSAIEQGATNNPSTNITTIAVNRFKITTHDVITMIGQAIPTNFSATAALYRITKANSVTNVDIFEIRDGSNHVDVTSYFSGTGRDKIAGSAVINKHTGISSGIAYGLFRLHIINIPITVDVGGFETTTHATISSGGTLLGVDAVNASVAGQGIDNSASNAVPYVATGTVSVLGHSVEVK